jgi:hypothetical protein
VRLLTFTMEGRDVDLRIKPSRASPGAGWMLSGQVLGPDGPGRVTVRCGPFEAEAAWSELCEYHVEAVPPGECLVSLHADDWEVVLPPIALPSTM